MHHWYSLGCHLSSLCTQIFKSTWNVNKYARKWNWSHFLTRSLVKNFLLCVQCLLQKLYSVDFYCACITIRKCWKVLMQNHNFSFIVGYISIFSQVQSLFSMCITVKKRSFLFRNFLYSPGILKKIQNVKSLFKFILDVTHHVK